MIFDNLAYYIGKNGLTVNGLAKLTGISEGTLRALQKGRCRSINVDCFAKMSKILGVTMDELYYGRDIPSNTDFTTQK